MTVDELKKTYAKLPGKKVRRARSVKKKAPYQGEPSDYILNFGQHNGTSLKDIPTQYLQWIVSQGESFSRPDVVSIVRRYLESHPSPAPVASAQRTSKVEGGSSTESLLSRLKAAGENSLFSPYEFPPFSHPIMDCIYGKRRLGEIPLRDLEDILERVPDENLRDFVARRWCHLYRWFVYDRYQKALSIDVSKLEGEGLLQYQETLNVCRRIQNVLDCVSDPERAKDILRSPQFDCVFRLKLPGAQ